MRIVTLIALGACTSEPMVPQASAPANLPPPMAFGLDVGTLSPGESGLFTISGAAPGEEVWLLRGRTAEAGPCIAALDDLCLDVTRPSVLGTALADDEGSAVFEITVPDTAPIGFVGLFQAVSERPMASEVVSRDVQHVDAIFDFSLSLIHI